MRMSAPVRAPLERVVVAAPEDHEQRRGCHEDRCRKSQDGVAAG